MSETGPVTPHRATILVGYGALGLEIQRRLLASAAPRGVLGWEEPHAGAAPSDRHLEDLALLWVPERAGPAGARLDEEDVREGSGLEMMRDLYRQIQQVGDTAPREVTFADALSSTAETLLSASTRAERRSALPLGLDVVVLARPTTREAIGTLDRMMVRGMDRLANNANLERAVQGAEALNFIAIYDFDNYWDRSDQGHSIRRALHASIEQWQRRRTANQPCFGRFYFVDGRTEDGIREPSHRVDEISLLLEFLLFEGQRDGELRRLYQPIGRHESTVGTFGIRVMERSAGLLSHLAAARFGIGWLDYLMGSGPFQATGEPVHLRNRLEQCGPEPLDQLLDAGSLRAAVDADLAALESELSALPIELSDWPLQLRAHCEKTAQQLEVRISQKARELMANIAGTYLIGLPEDLRTGVEADLHDPHDPAPLGRLITELEGSLKQLEQVADVVPTPPERAEDLLHGLEKLHSSYGQFHTERVQVEGLRRWWPLFAVAIASGLTPIVRDVLGDVPKPDPMKFIANRFYAVLQWIDNPLALAVILFLIVWALGAIGLQPRMAARIDRARRFYNDPDRGRFIGMVRSGLNPGGALRAPIDDSVDRVIHDMKLSVRGEVMRELRSVLERLKERRREMRWLRDQLRGFLRMHGVTSEDLRPDRGRLVRDGTGIRHAVERDEDLESMLAGNPPGPERFRSTQANQAPFAGWNERYSRAFLVPLDFVDRLSKVYSDPIHLELAHPGMGPQQGRLAQELRDFFRDRGSFSLAFDFKYQEGVPPDRKYCLLPSLWSRLPGVVPNIKDLGIGEESILTSVVTGRAYLLRVQTGVEAKCILEPE